MKKSSGYYYRLVTMLTIFLITISNLAFSSNKIELIQKAIEEKGASWVAGETWVSQLSDIERKQLCGSWLEAPADAASRLITLAPMSNLPPVFDWRNNNGNWVTRVQDQGQCGSCWAFSAVGQVEMWWMIKNARQDTMLDLSEQFVLSCSDGTCDGWWTGQALDFIRETGIPLETCFEYYASDAISCSSACNNWQEQAVSFPDWGYITLENDIIQNIKNAIYRHPISASFTVYEDFQSYHGGVYEHVWGEYDGGHAIVIVGWNDYEQSWICKNSWGSSWGEQGYFRMKWGECGMGEYIPFVYDAVTENNPVLVFPERLDFSLTVGDSAYKTFTIANYGAETVEYAVIGNDIPRWIDIENSVGKAGPGESITVSVGIESRTVDPGSYVRRLRLLTNDRTFSSPNIDIHIQVTAPDHDLAVNTIQIPAENVPILSTIYIAAEIKNCGLQAEADFFARCEIFDDQQRLYRDSTQVPAVTPSQTNTVSFKPFRVIKEGEYEFVVTIFKMSSDYNDYNNYNRSTLQVVNLIDGYESDTGNWLFEGGWGRTQNLTRYSGAYAAHVNSGYAPYLNNMDAVMTYFTGFDLSGLDHARLKYWTRYLIKPDGDICYLEVSSDFITWVKMDSIVGMGPRSWSQREIDLKDYLNDTVWIRFHFISNDAGTDFGVFIDDLELFTDSPTGVAALQPDADMPQRYLLSQNYPNPFNMETRINYYLPEAEEISIVVYNTKGQVVRKLLHAHQSSGHHFILWDGRDESGRPVCTDVYFVRLMTNKNFTMTRKLVFMK